LSVKDFYAVALLTLCAAPMARAGIVYQNDFETDTNGFSATSTTVLATDASGFSNPANTSTYLGQFNNGPVTLTLNGLNVGSTYNLAFDLFIGRSWDGNATLDGDGTQNVGPDHWSLTATGTNTATFVDTTFMALVKTDDSANPSGGILNDYTQNYSDSNPIGPGIYGQFEGADVVYTGGNVAGHWHDRYGIFYFGHGVGNPNPTFVATASTVVLSFAGSGLQDISDEFWAIDSVVLSTPDAAVPEPATLTIWGLGALGCAVAACGRKRQAA